MKIYLDELSLNITATIVSVNIFDKKLQKRINELGFFNGEKIKVLNHSTLKKTLLVELMHTIFAIKKSIAHCISVIL